MGFENDLVLIALIPWAIGAFATLVVHILRLPIWAQFVVLGGLFVVKFIWLVNHVAAVEGGGIYMLFYPLIAGGYVFGCKMTFDEIHIQKL
jgi:hypothetical protein